ncbi:hypothetical protein [Alicyclobacillus acidiphilus]|uniref:hypothetical protein n=1 Tax=Alicyclobacillus acidiphilus TaxID=182455 RepID=UPI00082B567C|nr:hypothetical protein [Alicyclobacillus acidiphilus]
MTMQEIRHELDEIQHEITHTLKQKSDQEIIRLLNRVEDLQYNFLRCPFIPSELTLPEIEDIRGGLIEAEDTISEFIHEIVEHRYFN